MKERDQKRKEMLKAQANAEKEKKKKQKAAAHDKDKTTEAEASAPSDCTIAVLGFARDIPAEESNLPETQYMELEHEAKALEPGLQPPPPPLSRRCSRQVCAWRGACFCLYFFASVDRN